MSVVFLVSMVSMYRYIQTLTLKKAPRRRDPFRLPGVLFTVTPPSWYAKIGGFRNIAVFFRFLPGKMPLVIQPGKGRLLPHSTPKMYSKRFFLSLFPGSHKNTPSIFACTAFSCPGWYKTIPKKEKPVTGLPGRYTGILHFKA